MRLPGLWVVIGLAACGGDPPPPDPALVERVGKLEARVGELEAAIERAAVREAVLPTVELAAPGEAAPQGPLVRILVGRASLEVDGTPVASGDLERVLAAKKGEGGLRVAIATEPEVSQSAVVAVLDVVEKLGGHVAITAKKSSGTGTGTGTGTEP